MPFQTAGPRGLPVSLFLSSPEQGLSVCVCLGGEGGELPGQPSQLLFPLPLEIFKERKQSFSWGAGERPHRIKTTCSSSPEAWSPATVCFPAARSSGSFKASHLGLSRRSSDGSGGEGAACAVSTFSNAHHPRALCSQPYPRRCVPMTVTVAMTVAAAAPRTRSAPGTSLAPSL